VNISISYVTKNQNIAMPNYEGRFG